MKKIIPIILIVILIVILFLFNSQSNEFSGKFNINKYDILEQNELNEFELLQGDYVFVMMPSPNEDNIHNQDSFLIITDINFIPKYSIHLNKLYDNIFKEENKLIINRVLYEDNQPLYDALTFDITNNIYSNPVETTYNQEDFPETYIMLGAHNITLNNDKQVLTLDDPHFNYNDNDYYITSFYQETTKTNLLNN